MGFYNATDILSNKDTKYYVQIRGRSAGKMYRRYELFGLYLKIIYDHMISGETPKANEESEVNEALTFLVTSREQFRTL